MNYFAALIVLLALFAGCATPTSRVVVSEMEKDSKPRRDFSISAELNPGEVLVVHSTRWEGGVKRFEFEEVFATSAGRVTCEVSLEEPNSDYWILREGVGEQHLRNVALITCAANRASLALELKSLAGREPQSYRFTWKASVQKWDDVKSRHSELAGSNDETATSSSRRVIFARDLSAGF